VTCAPLLACEEGKKELERKFWWEFTAALNGTAVLLLEKAAHASLFGYHWWGENRR
jgi:hypothetical protein